MNKHITVPASVRALLALDISANFFIFAEDPVISSARERQQQVVEASNVIMARAEAETRDLTASERTEVEGLANEFDGLEAQIGLRERVAAQNAILVQPRARATEPDPIDGEVIPPEQNTRIQNAAAPRPANSRVPAAPRVTAGGTMGFRNLGDFAQAVRMGSMRGGDLDARLRNAAVSTYGNEGSGADGGFAVPPDFRTDILAPIFNEDSLLSLTDRLQSAGNTMTFPTDSTTPWQTSGGVQAYWTAEGAAKTQSKPSLGETTVKLHTLAALVPMTEELLEDAPAMGSYLNRKAPEKMDFKVSDALVRGTGVGQPLGILLSPALVTVSKESGQAADTIVAANISNMWARLPVSSRRTAVWLMHPDAEAKLSGMTIANQPVYLPPGGLSGNMFGTLMGRPVIPHQTANTIGDLGDIMLVDWKQYLTITKTGNGRDANGLKSDVSIHLWFDQDMVAFRFTMRIAGAPWWAAPIAQRSGANTQSPYIVLEAR